MRKVNKVLSLLLILFCAVSIQAQVLMTKEQAVKQFFPEATATEDVAVTLTAEQITALKTKYGVSVAAPEVKFHVSKKGAEIIGRTLFLSDMGKHGLVWVGVGLGMDNAIKDLAVCSMKEQKGKPVAEKMYLKQYKGKKASDPIVTGKDIQAVSGATMSSKAVTSVAKKAVTIAETVYPTKK